ncbi:hypothetical protein BGZ52_010447, partial [Haplosporangium bisporale]
TEGCCGRTYKGPHRGAKESIADQGSLCGRDEKRSLQGRRNTSHGANIRHGSSRWF